MGHVVGVQGRIQEIIKGGAHLLKIILKVRQEGCGSPKGVGAGGGCAPSRAN